MEIPGRRGGTCVKFPSWWGYGYFLELHIVGFYHKLNYLKCLNFFVIPDKFIFRLVSSDTACACGYF